MKKVLTLALAFVALAGIVSCGGDDADPNQIVVDEVAAKLLNGYYVDWGTNSFRTDGESATHYMEFFITDGILEFDENGVPSDCIDCDLEVTIDAYSTGTSFAGGDYTVWDWCANGNLNGLWIDIENDDESIYASGYSGTISINGDAPNFKISFDFDVSDWNQCGAVRQSGTGCEGCNLAAVSGQFNKKFIEIDSEDVPR